MTEDSFLSSVARYYTEDKSGRPPLESLVFVLPNKRSAMFLKKHVRELVRGGVAMMPRFMTVRTFLSIFARYPEAPQNELLFILYSAYRRVMERRGRAGAMREFDAFIFWGDMMLSDFDDIDRSLVNADDLYKNLKNLKEIQADYLDEDQKEVIRRVWGESRITADASEFWMHLSEGDDAPMAAKFVYLWEIMAEVYHEFQRILEEKMLASAGAQYRSALEAIKNIGPDEADRSTHYVFVGFNDLSTAETLIFERLRTLGVASFFWDSAPLALIESAPSAAMARPMRRLRSLAANFPMPPDYEVPQAPFSAETAVTSVPSNVGQAKAIHSVLSQWADEGYIDSENPLNTAVILPDQGLLLPTLLSIPEDIGKINISMGLPYRTTTFASLLHSIISMQLRARTLRGATHYFYEDVNAVLAHPHLQLIARESADALALKVADDKLYNIPVAEIEAVAPDLLHVFTPVKDMGSVDEVASFLVSLLDWIERSLPDKELYSQNGFEKQAISFFRDEVNSLRALIEMYDVRMTDHTFLHLFERIFNARGLNVSGTPLEGMQLLGVLETRALDFDNIIILSMNERVFPRKQYTRTMIPNTLRAGFGLPDFESLEWTYAYCFYRLMARARRVQLFYDSRTEGISSGEKSRYISQMLYLMPQMKVTENSISYISEPDKNIGVEVRKTDEVMDLLNRFRGGGDRRFSATAFKTYKKCPLRFYLEYVRRMRGSDDLVDYISAAEFGTVVHNTIQELYSSYKDCLIDDAVFDRWLDPANDEVDRAALSKIIAERYPKSSPDFAELSAEARLAADLVANIARADLLAEKKFYCGGGESFTFIGNECKEDGTWKIDDNLDIRFYMSIDRIDRTDASSLRFIDYKTGDDEIATGSIDDLFGSDSHKKDGIFQLLTYCEAYLSITGKDKRLMPVLHPMRSLSSGMDLRPISIAKEDLLDYSTVREEFRARLAEFIKEIFDPEIPFTQCEDDKNCKFCPFLTLCGRTPSAY